MLCEFEFGVQKKPRITSRVAIEEIEVAALCARREIARPDVRSISRYILGKEKLRWSYRNPRLCRDAATPA